MNKILYRPIIVISSLLGLLILLEVIALGGITWRNLQRIDTIKEDIAYGHQLQQLIFELYTYHLQTPNSRHDPELLNDIIRYLQQHYPDTPETQLLVEKSKALSVPNKTQYQEELIETLLMAGGFFKQQNMEEEALLSQVYADSELELNYAIIIPAMVFLTLLLLNVRFLRSNIMAPLNSLQKLLSRLIEGEMLPIENNSVEPVLKPLFDNYNRLIIRLGELELEHANHRQVLEQEVRNATHTLLAQSSILAKAERLAAVGELAASAAHELRNPLAGIQAALRNIQSDCKEPELAERLNLVCNETKRMTQRLNHLLAVAKHAPEKAQAINLSKLTHELVTLLKYQIEDSIKINVSILTDIRPLLPETELRQALLNLILNSIQEIKQSGFVNIEVTENEHQVFITVTDSGHGFPESLLKNGIKPFVSTREQGTGLGLAMVQRFASSHSGQLLLQNNAVGHACATLVFPVTL